MVGIHWKGQFIEMVPWNGDVQVSAAHHIPVLTACFHDLQMPQPVAPLLWGSLLLGLL